MSITAALISFAFWRLVEPLPWVRPLGMLENNINQTTASASASIVSAGLVAPIPALAIISGKQLPWSTLAVWVFAVSMLGVVMAIGLRFRMLAEQKLRFPVGVATAETLRDIHGRSREAITKVKILCAAAGGSGALRAVQEFVREVPPLAPALSWPAPAALKGHGITQVSLKNLGWAFDPSLLMIGFGAIIGPRTGTSMLLGAFIAWGLLAPTVLSLGWAEPGTANAEAAWFDTLIEWLVWPGVVLLVTSSLTSFAFAFFRKRAGEPDRSGRHTERRKDAHEHLWLLAGLALTVPVAVAAAILIFDIAPHLALAAVAMGLLFAVAAARVVGETGIPPIGALGQVTQLGFGGLSPGNVVDNLMSGNITGGAADQCGDLLNDLKAGREIGAHPGRQTVAQCFGVVTGSLVGTGAYLLLIPDPQTMLITPEWPAPAVATWKAVAEVLSAGLGRLPGHLVAAMAVAGLLGIVGGILEHVLPERQARLLPSAPALGLACIIPAWISISLFLGAMLAAGLQRWTTFWTGQRILAAAAGLVAGESLVGVLAALLRFGGLQEY